MIDISAAAELLDFGTLLGQGQRAQEQLEGAVAIHNILQSHGVAYLADEVGMGKTYVALGALALFRHFQPDFRVLIIAPRENIQVKWMKEFRNFVANNVRIPDMRVKGLDGRPARPLVACRNLLDFVQEATIDPNRDFFLRLTSFSLGIAGRDAVDPAAARAYRNGLRRYLPWLQDEVFDLRNKKAFKDNFARALCCALPTFDLVIVDEGHNLKHGFAPEVAARNRVLALAMGHPKSGASSKLFPGFASRDKRVLFLSATPVEETYRHLWNQLDVFGAGAPFEDLKKSDVDEEIKKTVAARILIRRVTAVRVGNSTYTKNLYRREWRRGGVIAHDEPIRTEDTRERLVVALVQKKVSELLGHERFNNSFQIEMLASFESFLETAKLKHEDIDVPNFDDAEQTEDDLEKEGIDVSQINRLSSHYRRTFDTEMPHPKMDALVNSLKSSWTHGKKSLVFVRRVASVKDLKRKLDDCYDTWLIGRLLRELPASLHERIQSLFRQYRDERTSAYGKARGSDSHNVRSDDDSDRGGYDTFFAWFFRGEGPSGVISGANIQQRFIQRGTAFSTFFEENYLADILACRPEEVRGRLAEALQVTINDLQLGLQTRAKRYLSDVKKHARADLFEAAQAAAVEWLKNTPGPYHEQAGVVWAERFQTSLRHRHVAQAPYVGHWLELPTFFTELRNRSTLHEHIWPLPHVSDYRSNFRQRELRAQLLASAARLGHGFIDLYVMVISRIGSLELRAQEATEGEADGRDVNRINEYLDMLERQMQTPLSDREWGAYDELAEIAANFDLILDVNLPEARDELLSETAKACGRLLRQQQPVGGMSGQVNQTLVRQFRLPGYPFVLITTDLLQEGEDLHTFCSSVHHYGISWTPSSMEQRIGRIDRVRSHTERRLACLTCPSIDGEDKLQVYFPHLEDTIEVLQVQRVLERMNVFLRLMHEGLTTTGSEERSIDASKEFVKTRRIVPQILDVLKSAFPVRPEHLRGKKRALLAGRQSVDEIAERFNQLRNTSLPGVDISWEPQMSPGRLLGTAQLKHRVQPFTLVLKSIGDYPIVRCISPVGCVGPDEDQESILHSTAHSPMKIGAIIAKEERTYDLTVEGDVILGSSAATDTMRVGMLISRVVSQADILEQTHLPGHDEVLETFRSDLVTEAIHGH